MSITSIRYYIIYLYIFFLPIITILSQGQFNQFTDMGIILPALSVILMILLSVFKNRSFVIPDLRINIILIIMLLYSFFAVFFAKDIHTTFTSLILICLTLLFYLSIYQLASEDINFVFLKKLLILVNFQMIFLVLFQIYLDKSGSVNILGAEFIGHTVALGAKSSTSIYVNPNQFGIVLTVGMIGNLLLLSLEKRTSYKIMYLFIFLILGYFVLQTNSRTSLFSILIITIIYITYKSIKMIKKQNAKLLLISFSSLLIMFFILNMFSNTGWSQSLSSFSDQLIIFDKFGRGDLGLSGRENRWNDAIEMIKEQPIFGVGVLSQLNEYILIHATHNGYINLALRGGVPLLILYLLFMTFTYVKSIRVYFNLSEEKKELLLVLILSITMLLLQEFFEQQITFAFHISYSFILLWITLAYIFSITRNKNKSLSK